MTCSALESGNQTLYSDCSAASNTFVHLPTSKTDQPVSVFSSSSTFELCHCKSPINVILHWLLVKHRVEIKDFF